MQKLTILVTCLPALALCCCKTMESTESYSWFATINGSRTCNGVSITLNLVLTADNCGTKENPEQTQVTLGYGWNVTTLVAKKIFTHPSKTVNLALISLPRQVNVKAALIRSEPLKSKVALLPSLKKECEGNEVIYNFSFTSVEIDSDEACSKLVNNFDKDKQLCVTKPLKANESRLGSVLMSKDHHEAVGILTHEPKKNVFVFTKLQPYRQLIKDILESD